MNNNTKIVLAVIVSLVIGGAGGYLVAEDGVKTANAAQIQQMTDMMKTDGTSMEKAGGMMVQAGTLLQDRGTKYNDQEMVMMGKDLSANGAKHQADGQSMTGGDMMGMTANGNMESMPGMDMSGMKM
jgi:threonine aldolase